MTRAASQAPVKGKRYGSGSTPQDAALSPVLMCVGRGSRVLVLLWDPVGLAQPTSTGSFRECGDTTAPWLEAL